MTRLLSADQLRSFREHGVAYPLRVLSAGEAAAYRRACDELETLLGGRPRTVEVRQMHLHFAWAWRLATTPRVLDAAQDLLGPNLLIWATELFAKHSRDGAVSIGWHRDGPYMGLDPARTVSAWIALSPSVRENGCMCVVREANRQMLRTKQPAPGDVIEEITLSPGEMSLHDVHVLHGSQANRSDHKRVGFTIRFTTPEGRPSLKLPPAILARGEDRFGHFRLLQPPGETDAAASLEAMRCSAREHLDATLMNLKQAASSELPYGPTS